MWPAGAPGTPASFTVTPPPDLDAPTLTVDTVADGQVEGSAVTVTASASDHSGIDTVRMYYRVQGGEATFALSPDDELELIEVVREPWDSQPWAVGLLNQNSTEGESVDAGQPVPGNAVFSFDLGTRGAASRFVDSLELARCATSLGGPETLVCHPATSTHASLTSAQQHLDLEALHQAVDLLARARSISLCGLCASASVALDAQHKLLRFPMPVMAHTDIINQRMAATGLAAGDCLVCISYTGRTTAMVELAELARDNGARVLALTAPRSPLADACDLVLGVEGGEDTDLYTPMSSRVAQLVIIDVLATCLALRRGEEFGEHLACVKQNLRSTRHQA